MKKTMRLFFVVWLACVMGLVINPTLSVAAEDSGNADSSTPLFHSSLQCSLSDLSSTNIDLNADVCSPRSTKQETRSSNTASEKNFVVAQARSAGSATRSGRGGATCRGTLTCSGGATCGARPTWSGGGGTTCRGTVTCSAATCAATCATTCNGQTCLGSQTCSGNLTCSGTCEGSGGATCQGNHTCSRRCPRSPYR